jgi:methionyl-tRNA formyltransferase
MNIFLGNSLEILEEIVKHLQLNLVVTENKSNKDKIIKFCRDKNIKCVVINSWNNIIEAIQYIDEINICFVASFGIILKNKFIKKCKYIINFHPGDIEVCRGRHPLPSAIINKHKTMGATVHLIDSEDIDAGPLLAKIIFPIDYDKSYKYNENRLYEGMKMLIFLLIKDYMNKGRFISYKWDLSKSIYYKPLDREKLQQIVNSKKIQKVLR